MSLWCAGLVCEDESRADPDAGGTEHKGCRNALAVEQTSSSNDLHGLAARRLLAFAHSDNGGNKDGRGDISSMSTALTALCADHVDANVETLLDVLGMSDHVHVENAMLVELVDDGLGWHTDGRDEQLCARLDDDIDELTELALCVVVALKRIRPWLFPNTLRHSCLLGLARRATDLRQ